MKLPRSILAGISAPALPIAGLGLPIVVYLPNFFANTVGISLAMVGVIFMLAMQPSIFTHFLRELSNPTFRLGGG